MLRPSVACCDESGRSSIPPRLFRARQSRRKVEIEVAWSVEQMTAGLFFGQLFLRRWALSETLGIRSAWW